MSGYSGAIVLAIITLTILPLSYITWHHNQILISDFRESLLFINKYFYEINTYNININESDVYWENQFILTFWVLNTGSSSIPIDEFEYIDVILIYNSSEGSKIILWVPYNPKGAPGKDIFWRVEGVRVGGSEDEVINPIYPPPNRIGVPPESGMWDPGEELLFVAYLTPAYAADTTLPVTIFISLKCGCYDQVTVVGA